MYLTRHDVELSKYYNYKNHVLMSNNDIDSLPVSIDTLSSLFADDLLMYRIINTSEDYKELQSDVVIVCNWVDENKLAFNRNKCKYMVVSRLQSRAQLVEPMLLHGEPIERVTSYKYLGVILTDNLSWSMHIDRISSKARRLVGLLYRKFYKWASSEALLNLYLGIVRPHLEYAVPVWNP